MRSRFSAYALHLTDYIIQTTDPTGTMWKDDAQAWRAEIEDFSRHTAFRELKVEQASADGEEGLVRFRCVLMMGDQEQEVAERSRFRRVGGRWLYHSGSRV